MSTSTIPVRVPAENSTPAELVQPYCTGKQSRVPHGECMRASTLCRPRVAHQDVDRQRQSVSLKWQLIIVPGVTSSVVSHKFVA